MIDVHCHLTYQSMRENLPAILDSAKKEMQSVITCGLVNDVKDALELRRNNKGFVHLTLGIHPEDVVAMRDEQIERHMDLIRSVRKDIVGIGEVGLDYHWIKEPDQIKRCKEWFKKFLDLAAEMKLPVVLHTRKAEEDSFEIVSQTDLKNVVFHHYSGNVTLAQQIIDRGYYISMPTITPTSKNLLRIAERFPLSQLVTETDSPFNSPYPGKGNVPNNVRVTIEKIAEKRGMSFDQVDAALSRNAQDIFGI
jgi:TatD DNase family protein